MSTFTFTCSVPYIEDVPPHSKLFILFAFSSHPFTINIQLSQPHIRNMSCSSAYKWLRCDNHAKVTHWFLTLDDRHEYPIFYSSFVNAANRSWSIYQQYADHKRLQPLDYLFIDCLAEDPIPADMLIDALSAYNKLIGGTKGYLKGKGLIKCQNLSLIHI